MVCRLIIFIIASFRSCHSFASAMRPRHKESRPAGHPLPEHVPEDQKPLDLASTPRGQAWLSGEHGKNICYYIGIAYNIILYSIIINYILLYIINILYIIIIRFISCLICFYMLGVFAHWRDAKLRPPQGVRFRGTLNVVSIWWFPSSTAPISKSKSQVMAISSSKTVVSSR